MPWTGPQFSSRHNQKLKGEAARKAAAQATAMVKSGVNEGVAIAVASKTGNKLQARADRRYRSRG